MISVVIETWNLARDGAAAATVAPLIAELAPQLAALDAELVITCAGPAPTCALAYPATWLALPADAGYYDHKNGGFDATHGDVVAFLDGDCAPSTVWLAALTQPITAHGARVVAGFTAYAGPLARVASQLDFPYFAAGGPHAVRNFFANNVAFARAVFAARRYPDAPMFHGQCQLLALRLRADGIAIRFARDARVVHAAPGDLRAWLAVRLLRGADTVSLLPHVVASYAPRAKSTIVRLGALPALALLGLRALTGTLAALRRGPRVRNLALVAACTLVDSLGAAAAPVVYRRLA